MSVHGLSSNLINRNRLSAVVERYCLIWAFANLPSSTSHLVGWQRCLWCWVMVAIDRLVRLAPAARRPPSDGDHNMAAATITRANTTAQRHHKQTLFLCLHRFCLRSRLTLASFLSLFFFWIHFLDAKANYRPLMVGYSVCISKSLWCVGFFGTHKFQTTVI